jgi:type IV secretory pathway component VirB8
VVAHRREPGEDRRRRAWLVIIAVGALMVIAGTGLALILR